MRRASLSWCCPPVVWVVLLGLGLTSADAQHGPWRQAADSRDDTSEPAGDTGGAYPELLGTDDGARRAEVSPLVKRILDDELTPADQRRALRIWHGDWDGLDAQTPEEAGWLALHAGRLDDPVFGLDALPARLRALGALRRGEAEKVLAVYPAWRDAEGQAGGQNAPPLGDVAARVLRAQAFMQLNQLAAAQAELEGIRERYRHDPVGDALAHVEAARAITMMARLEGRQGLDDFRLAMNLLKRVREEIDPLYWPAYLLEAEILAGKGNPEQAVEAAFEALALNPNCGEAWGLVGLMSARHFKFEQAEAAIEELQAIQPEHPQAAMVAAALHLREKRPELALSKLEPMRSKYPKRRDLLALHAEAFALQYDDASRDEAVQAYEALSPGSAEPYFAVGRLYSDARQYALSREYLEEALRREPGWSAPRGTLGAMLMQQGDLPEAELQLRIAADADPSNFEVVNYLTLVSRMLGWETLVTDRLIVRYSARDEEGQPHPDAVWARDIARLGDELANVIIERYGYAPEVRTQIDLMPDDRSFGVRVLGLPGVITVGACTGDVIALTSPRPGPNRRFDTYNWPLVFLHEYAHVVTLGKTRNRIPHWFTEAFAVSEEPTGRTWSRYRQLAEASNHDALLHVRDLSFSFIRPQRQGERALAYAQSHWILEYLVEHHGPEAPITMMKLQRQGLTNAASLQQVTGEDPDAFMAGFTPWAQAQVASWGLAQEPLEGKTAEKMYEAPDSLSREEVNGLVEMHPDHPHVLRLAARRAMDDPDPLEALAAVEAYAQACPVDPWAHRARVILAARAGDRDLTEQSLQALDRLEGNASEYALQLADFYESDKDYAAASEMLWRVLIREPFSAIARNRAVRLSLLAKNLEEAEHHLTSLSLLEPNFAPHFTRLAYLRGKLNDSPGAAEAAKRALQLDPDAPVQRFLTSPGARGEADVRTPLANLPEASLAALP